MSIRLYRFVCAFVLDCKIYLTTIVVQDYANVAGVITNYSLAEIPLETMWTDIDYMFNRRIFTNDPQYFPTDKMREIVDYLHSHDQHYGMKDHFQTFRAGGLMPSFSVMMTDPAVAYLPNENYSTFDRGVQDDIFLKNPNGTYHLGVVWPGVTVFPGKYN